MAVSDATGFQSFDTPLDAPIEIYTDRHGVSAIFFNLDHQKRRSDRPNALTRTAARQLREYFEGKRQTFDLPLSSLALDNPVTEYRRKVWSTLLEIPYGQTRTYTDIAKEAGGSPRSVGTANGRNPLCIVVPCHRVVGKNGLGGYGGPLIPEKGAELLEIKRRLLEHEQHHV